MGAWWCWGRADSLDCVCGSGRGGSRARCCLGWFPPPPVASAAPLYSAGGRRLTSKLSQLWPSGRGVSNPSTCTSESGHARLLRSGYTNSEDAGPGYPSSPKEQRDSRGEDQQVRQTSPSKSPGILHLGRRRGRGPAEDPGPHNRPPRLVLLSLCVVPMVNYAPLVEITSAEADYRRFDQLIAKSFTGGSFLIPE